jgi:hypothetical protein
MTTAILTINTINRDSTSPLPASRRRDTPTYEYALVNRQSGQLAIVQVKTGRTLVDVALLVRAAGKNRLPYAYATSGNNVGAPVGRQELRR